ncbi:hypothetical protein HATV-3_gp50 [Haloarcula tailed virus 3]|uniref:Uncharacterized protein n=1 Tax=Haloarcula tailed virus 3 TaxID=2877990 RepID=A0AAE8XZ74_9CAUD|nr:hypothetical protein M1M35_gp50 [Haloarcula tailed virus 3]UBF23400.1 hypothetical protein HATV-3_gp50 [Haloarcula tailed virus 3]
MNIQYYVKTVTGHRVPLDKRLARFYARRGADVYGELQ